MEQASTEESAKPSINITTDMLDINKDETIITLTKFVESFAKELTVKIQHINTIEKLSGLLNIYDLIKFELNLIKIS